MLSEVLEELRQGWNRGDPGEVARGQDNKTSRGGNDHIIPAELEGEFVGSLGKLFHECSALFSSVVERVAKGKTYPVGPERQVAGSS